MSPRLELYQHVAITHYLYYFIQDRYQERKTARYTIIIYSDTSFPTCYSKQNIRRERGCDGLHISARQSIVNKIYNTDGVLLCVFLLDSVEMVNELMMTRRWLASSYFRTRCAFYPWTHCSVAWTHSLSRLPFLFAFALPFMRLATPGYYYIIIILSPSPLI